MSRTTIFRPTPSSALPAITPTPVTTEVVVMNPVAIPNPLLPGVASLPLMVIVPANALLEKTPFEIIASGTIQTVASGTATLKLYGVPSAILQAGTAATLGNDTALGTSGAVTQNTATAPFVMHAKDVVYDSTSGKMTGKVGFMVNNVLVAEAAFSAVMTGISGANDPVIGFLLTLTQSAGAAGAQIIVEDFEIA